MKKTIYKRRLTGMIRPGRAGAGFRSDPVGAQEAGAGGHAIPSHPEGMQDASCGEVQRHTNSLLDSLTTGIISLDGEGRVKVFNAAAEMLFGLPRSRVIGRLFGEITRIFHFKDHALRALWERLSDAIWAAGAALDLEYDIVRQTGPRRVVSYSVYPLGRMAWSVGNGVVIMFDDITRKKELEDQISDGRKRLLAVFDGITDGIQVVDAEFRITAVNKSMTALLGRTIKLGAHCYHACAFDTRICTDCPALETFHTGQPASITKRLYFSAPSPASEADARVVEISTFPLLDRGNRVVQVVEYIKDVTEKARLAERLEHSRRLAEIGEMAARVAHEVRNPLNAITGAAHYLSTEYADDEVIQKFTSLIKRQSMRVDQVASDILHASRPPRLDRTNVNVNAVLARAIGSLRDQMAGQGIKLETMNSPDLPQIQADELQIEQALYNILLNAVEAMPAGGGLRVTTAPGEEGGWVKICVQDTGPGIPTESRERIFQSFFTTKAYGTGLGLSIVQGVLKNHGGDIRVEQPEDGGTRVVLCLPVKSGDRARMPESGPRTASENATPLHAAPHVSKFPR